MTQLDSLSGTTRERVRAIYEEAFPARQRVPFEELVEASRDGDEITLAALENAQPIGFAFFGHLDAVDCLFLEYFAVAADRRGRGFGHALWKATVDALRAHGERRAIVLEVEDPEESGIEHKEAGQRMRRVRFWEQVGACPLAVDGYIIPNLDDSGVEPMRLMWMAGADGARAPDAEALLELILALYREGYGLSSSDPLVERARRVWG